ncbi:MAG: DUF928 domain-containing protein [Synechococcales bacterium]|nr:DUF928 domain-containing protein [Synechococcales bacterium]
MHQAKAIPNAHSPRRLAAIALTAGLLVVGFPWAAIAQQYNPPPVGLPGRREGGGTRGDCSSADKPLMALMPDTNFGQTVSDYPTFYWYVPQISAEAAEFVLLDEDNNEIFITTFAIADQPGVISLSLPEGSGMPPLEVGKDYNWYFSLICDFSDRSGDLFTNGWIRRVDTTTLGLGDRLMTASESDRALIYAEAGLWFEALDTLARLRRLNPSDPAVQAQWGTLLRSVGLDEMVNEPFLPSQR